MKMNEKKSEVNEWLDVVDEQNHIIGQALRDEVHRKGLRHRAAHLVIFNRQGDLLLQKRSRNKSDFPGFWDSSAAGHLAAGESYEACILREAVEELGIELGESCKKLFLLPASPETGMEFCQVFRASHEGPFVLNKEEVEDVRWYSENEIEAWLKTGGAGFTSTIRIMLAKLDFGGWK